MIKVLQTKATISEANKKDYHMMIGVCVCRWVSEVCGAGIIKQSDEELEQTSKQAHTRCHTDRQTRSSTSKTIVMY